MKFIGNRSLSLLANQKSKSKHTEFDVDSKLFPSFNKDIDDLIVTTESILFRACLKVFCGQEIDAIEDLHRSYEYFEALSRDKTNVNNSEINNHIRLLGAITSIILEEFGPAMVFLKKYNNTLSPTPLCKLLIEIMKSTLGIIATINYEKYSPTIPKDLLDPIVNYLEGNITFADYSTEYKKMENHYAKNPDNFYYYYFIYVFIVRFEENRASLLLPFYSALPLELWNDYLTNQRSIKLLWKAQKMICKAGFLKGKSGSIAMPTGSGKTRSIELIIESRRILNQTKKVLIVAPLRSLVNEINNDLSLRFGNAVVNSISDLNIGDYADVFGDDGFKILISTPEKIDYILHHNANILGEFQLIIFDEAQLISDGSRGLNYELLLSYIKRSKTDDQQIVLLAAVISNIEEINNWLFNEKGVLVDECHFNLKNKSIGFYSPSSNTIDFFDGGITATYRDYFIPNVISHNSEKDINMRDKNEIAVFLANKMSKAGMTTIFVPKANQINKTLEVAINSSSIDEQNDEVRKINNFIKLNYGEESVIYQASSVGYYSHYGNEQNGLRILLENSFKSGVIRKLVTTSTLAQGVNLPIKNFIIKDLYTGDSIMDNKSFRNLIGRVARPDKETNGNIIVLDLATAKNKSLMKVISIYKEMLNPLNTINCLSSLDPLNVIRSLMENGVSDDELNMFNDFICDATFEKNDDYLSKIEDIGNRITAISLDNDESKVGAFTSHIALENINENNFFETINSVIESTFLFNISEDDKKAYIKALLFAWALNYLKNTDDTTKMIYSVTLGKQSYIENITKWIKNIDLNHLDDIKEEVTVLYYNSSKYIQKKKMSYEAFKKIVNSWICGSSVKEINEIMKSEKCFKSVFDVDAFIKRCFDYDFSLFVSNVVDVIKIIDGNYPTEILEDYSKQIKYGLPTRSSILFYNNIFKDRLLSVDLDRNILKKEADLETLKEGLSGIKDSVLKRFVKYPTFFYKKLSIFLN